MNFAFSKIWILIIILIFIGGGFLAWQYFGMPKEKVEAPRTDEEQVAQLVSKMAEWWNNANWRPEYENMSSNFRKLISYDRFATRQNAFLTTLRAIHGQGKIEITDIKVKVEGEFAYASYVIKIGETTLPVGEDIYRKVEERWYNVEDDPVVPGYNREDMPGKKTEDETADWKTYRNRERSFEIKYPEDWEMDIVDPWHSIDFTKETFLETIRFAIGINIYGEFGIPFTGCTFRGKEITIETIKVYPKIFSDLKNEHSNPTKEECEKQMLGNSHAVYLTMCFDKNLKYLGNYCEEGSGNFYYQFYFLCEGEKWQGREGMNNCSQLFNQMLSTFRFLE